jgi:hypothetical protein
MDWSNELTTESNVIRRRCRCRLACLGSIVVAFSLGRRNVDLDGECQACVGTFALWREFSELSMHNLSGHMAANGTIALFALLAAALLSWGFSHRLPPASIESRRASGHRR